MLKFLAAYADPTAGHLGTIYQATNWLYTRLSEASPLFVPVLTYPKRSES